MFKQARPKAKVFVGGDVDKPSEQFSAAVYYESFE